MRLPMPCKASGMTEQFRVHGRAPARTTPRAPHRGSQRNGPLMTTRVHPDAHALALILAQGDPARLRILSTTQVLILNRARKPPTP